MSKRTITLIVPSAAEATASTSDRMGGETHGLSFGTSRLVKIDAEKVRASFHEVLDEVEGLLSEIERRATEGWEIDNVTVGLSISGGGSIGVATAGAEASISVSFAPRS